MFRLTLGAAGALFSFCAALAQPAELLRDMGEVRAQTGEFGDRAGDRRVLPPVPRAPSVDAWAECTGPATEAQARIASCTAVIERGVQDSPRDLAFAFAFRGNAYYGGGNYKAAFADYDQSVALDPDNPTHFFNRAMASDALRRTSAALADFDQAIRMRQVNGNYFRERGRVWLRKGDPDLAIADLTNAIRLNPNDDSALYQRAKGHTRKLALAQAQSDLNAALGVNPKNLDVKDLRDDLSAAQDADFGEEMTDFHLPPQVTLFTQVSGPTPASIPGGDVITTPRLVRWRTEGLGFRLIDALSGQHDLIEGSYHLEYAGQGGAFDDTIQKKLAEDLQNLTRGDKDYYLVFACLGVRCREGYNAALRAIDLGYRNVLWYRGGLTAWTDRLQRSRAANASGSR